MSESIHVSSSATRKEKYAALLPQLKALLGNEKDSVANMANFCSAVQMAFNFHWIGFYRVQENELVLGPFQGPVACTRIPKGKGVCGTAWAQDKPQIVANVSSFPGHIACSALSQSELVIPIRKNNTVIGVLDIDSDKPNDFSRIDEEGMCALLQTLEAFL